MIDISTINAKTAELVAPPGASNLPGLNIFGVSEFNFAKRDSYGIGQGEMTGYAANLLEKLTTPVSDLDNRQGRILLMVDNHIGKVVRGGFTMRPYLVNFLPHATDSLTVAYDDKSRRAAEQEGFLTLADEQQVIDTFLVGLTTKAILRGLNQELGKDAPGYRGAMRQILADAIVLSPEIAQNAMTVDTDQESNNGTSVTMLRQNEFFANLGIIFDNRISGTGDSFMDPANVRKILKREQSSLDVVHDYDLGQMHLTTFEMSQHIAVLHPNYHPLLWTSRTKSDDPFLQLAVELGVPFDLDNGFFDKGATGDDMANYLKSKN